ncbi:MAG: beta strand repeat-containing protein, partial [Rhodopirellula sp. JB053]
MRRRLLLSAILAGCAMPTTLFAQAPVGGNIVAGAGTIDNSVSNLTNITTSTDRAVINWDDFSVGSGHTVNFDQLNSNSAVLNRVIGSAPQSLINGAITSNGNVFVSNASGVVIGSTGVINTNGFTATTLDITNDRFMNGDLSFSGNSDASIVNNGLISTGDGGANLIASQVFNNGTIESTGNINLATGGQLKMPGGQYIQADLETINNGISNGSSLIQNSGTIRAIGGLNVGGEVYLVNPNGNIVNEATIIAKLSSPDGSQSGGTVEMVASADASLTNASIDVSGQEGGRVVVTGDRVEVTSSNIDASGELGGGEVRIGGGWKGQDATVANASTTKISSDSQISVDATVNGDAGSVVVWADQTTDFAGQINARALGAGDGGQAEVSGKQDLVFTGNADLRASSPEGEHGTLLLDPATFTLDSSNQDAIRAQWGSSNLVIEAVDSIDIDVDLFPTVSSGGDEKNGGDGSKTSLTLREQSGGDGAVEITIAAAIRDYRSGGATVDIDAGTGGVTVTADGSLNYSLGGSSQVTVSANSFDVAGSASINTLIATGNESVGVGSAATGTMTLSDETISNIGSVEIQGGDIDVDMGGPASSYSTLKLVSDTVNIDRFEGHTLDIESNDLTITGPVIGGGTFRFIGQSNRSIGLGSGIGDLQFSKEILAGITGFNSFEMGHNTNSGSDISIVDAGLNFNSVILRGSAIDIDRLSIGKNLTLYTDSLNVQNALTKTDDTGSLIIQSMTSSRTAGLGDGTAGLLNITADEFDHLGLYSTLDVTVGSGDVTVNMDFTGNYSNRVRIDNASSLIHLNGVSIDSSLFQLISNDLQISQAVTGDIDATALDLNGGVSRMAVGSAAPGDYTLDNTEFALLSNFKEFTLHNTQVDGMLDVAGVGIGNELDFSSITPGSVSLLSDSMRLSDVSVAEALKLSVYSGLALDGGVTTDGSDATLTITAGRASNGVTGSTTVGIGDGTTGAVHLDDDEINRIQHFDTVDVSLVSSSPPGSAEVNATFDKNLTLRGGAQTTIESLTMTNGSDLDVRTYFKSGGSGNPGADKIVVGQITSDGNISLDSSRVEVNGDAHTIHGDVLVDATITTIGDGTQTSHAGIGSANGTTTVKTRDLNINASNTAGAQVGYAFSGTETATAAGDIVVETSGDVNLSGHGSHFASIGHGDSLGGDDTGKTVSGDVTLEGGMNVNIENGHVGHLIDANGTYASGSTSVFAGRRDFNENNENRES